MADTASAEVQGHLQDYWVTDLLGTGARSEIFEIKRRDDGHVFAVKYISANDDEDFRVIGHLENEYKVLSELHDTPGEGAEHIVRPHEFQKVKRFFRVKAAYLIMDKVEGPTLAEDYDYELDEILTIFRQICAGLEHIHKTGYVHADLKPHNILIDDDLHTTLIDFGFAAPVGEMLESFKGTFGYVAPEQAGGRITEKTDVFNLGAALYWVLTGQNLPSIMPGDHESHGFVPDERVTIPPPSRVNPEVPEELAQMVVQCCSFKEYKRPTVHRLRQYLHGLQLRLEYGTV